MRCMVMAGLVMLGGCAGSQTTASVPAPPSGDAALAAVGSPLLVIGKLPLCILTLVAAAPVGALSEASDPADPFGHDLRQDLSDGLAQNCGPPYVVAP